jgi:NAD(P)-dependent dehydrogenase (short-subunit alcohol dehydrogenase family)
MIQANYIGPFVLTNILLPLLKNSSTPSRVVNLTSFTHRCVSEINLSEKGLSGVRFGHWPARRSYLLASTYEYTKFCLLMFSYELHRQLHLSSGVSVMYVPSILVACIFFFFCIFSLLNKSKLLLMEVIFFFI